MTEPENHLRQHRVDPATSPFAFVWEDRGRKLAVLRRTAQANTGFRPGAAVVQATPACLIADGEDTPQVFCASGWRPQEGTQTSSRMLDGARWTELVRRFAAVCPPSFRLPRSFRDTPKSSVHVPENGGRYYACHTEKKLALYFLVQQMKFSGVGLRETLAGRLRSVPLPPNRRGATIFLGHKPCKNCRLFLRFIRLRTGITLRTQPSSIYVEHQGRPAAFRDGKPTERGEDAESAEVDASAMRDADVDDDGDELADAAGQDDAEAAGEAAADVDEDVKEDEDDENDRDAVENPDALDFAEALLANAPTGNVMRPRAGDPSRPTTPAGPDEEAPAATAPSPPRTPVRTASTMQQLSPVIRDTPEPSLSPSLSQTPDRRQRFPPYETPTRRRRQHDDDDSSVAPPAVWQGRSKPPVTPSMQPPPWLLAEGSDRSDDGDDEEGPGGGGGGAATTANVSYHFATPSDPSREGTSNGDGDGDSSRSLAGRDPAKDKPQPGPAAPAVRAAPRPQPPRTVTFQVPEASFLPPIGRPTHNETRPGHGDGVDSSPSQAWRRVRRNLFPAIARPPQPPTAAATDETVMEPATRPSAAPFLTPFATRAAWAADDTEAAGADASLPAGVAAMPLYARHTQQLAQQDEQQRVQQRRPAAGDVIDLTDEPDETPVAPRTAFPPRPAPQRRRGTTARGRAKRRGASSGPLASSSGRRRFPSLDGYRYNDLSFGHV